jgi:hypothetical protein
VYRCGCSDCAKSALGRRDNSRTSKPICCLAMYAKLYSADGRQLIEGFSNRKPRGGCVCSSLVWVIPNRVETGNFKWISIIEIQLQERLPPLALSIVLARAQTGLGSRKFLRLLFQRV